MAAKSKRPTPPQPGLFDKPQPTPLERALVAAAATGPAAAAEQRAWDHYVGGQHRPTLPRLPDYVPDKKLTMPEPYRRNNETKP